MVDGETWQEAAVRECFEETGIVIDPLLVQDFLTRTNRTGSHLTFGVAPPMMIKDLPPFIPNEEASERVIVRDPSEIAFPLHREAMARFWGPERCISGYGCYRRSHRG